MSEFLWLVIAELVAQAKKEKSKKQANGDRTFRELIVNTINSRYAKNLTIRRAGFYSPCTFELNSTAQDSTLSNGTLFSRTRKYSLDFRDSYLCSVSGSPSQEIQSCKRGKRALNARRPQTTL
jgi:hypothetical protein